MRDLTAGLHCPKCGSDMIQREHPNGTEPGVIYYCMCCLDDEYDSARHFRPKRFPSHTHGPSCKQYEGWREGETSA